MRISDWSSDVCSSDLMEKELPGVEVVAANSNAEAARLVAEEGDSVSAAVAPALAAKIYGLDVLATDIEDHAENQTRFVLVGRGPLPPPTGPDKPTIVVFQRPDRAGSMLAILQIGTASCRERVCQDV